MLETNVLFRSITNCATCTSKLTFGVCGLDLACACDFGAGADAVAGRCVEGSVYSRAGSGVASASWKFKLGSQLQSILCLRGARGNFGSSEL